MMVAVTNHSTIINTQKDGFIKQDATIYEQWHKNRHPGFKKNNFMKWFEDFAASLPPNPEKQSENRQMFQQRGKEFYCSSKHFRFSRSPFR